jgi:hypothetical protein
MVFSANGLGAEPIVVVVAEDETVGSVVDEQLAVTNATHATSPAMHVLATNSPIAGA